MAALEWRWRDRLLSSLILLIPGIVLAGAGVTAIIHLDEWSPWLVLPLGFLLGPGMSLLRVGFKVLRDATHPDENAPV